MSRRVRVPDGRVWLRVASRDWDDPLDSGYARDHGGRWNAPGSYPALYLNGDVVTAQLQIERMLAGSPVAVGDLDDEAFVLVAAVLPRAQRAADAVTEDVLRSLGLPGSYPRDARGDEVGYDVCQRAGRQVQKSGLRGVWCRSACTSDGRGRELAWFPATDRSKARAVWRRALPLAAWRYASGWSDLGLVEQPDPTI